MATPARGLLHNPDEIWIEALVKETEIRRIQIGQPVEILVDAYPDEVFSGTVSRSRFSKFTSKWEPLQRSFQPRTIINAETQRGQNRNAEIHSQVGSPPGFLPRFC